jgi:hypothetical protein
MSAARISFRAHMVEEFAARRWPHFRFSQAGDLMLSTGCERTRMSEVTPGGRPEDY